MDVGRLCSVMSLRYGPDGMVCTQTTVPPPTLVCTNQTQTAYAGTASTSLRKCGHRSKLFASASCCACVCLPAKDWTAEQLLCCPVRPALRAVAHSPGLHPHAMWPFGCAGAPHHAHKSLQKSHDDVWPFASRMYTEQIRHLCVQDVHPPMLVTSALSKSSVNSSWFGARSVVSFTPGSLQLPMTQSVDWVQREHVLLFQQSIRDRNDWGAPPPVAPQLPEWNRSHATVFISCGRMTVEARDHGKLMR